MMYSDCRKIPHLHRAVFLFCFDIIADSDSRFFALLLRVFFADSLPITLALDKADLEH